MNDHEPIHDPAGEPAEPPTSGELVPSGGGDPAALTGRDGVGLARWLEQSHRDAAAGRAQTRELVRTLEQVRDAHEYVGKALRDEQSRNRRLTAALVLAPVLAGLLVWGVWTQLDSLRSDLGERVGEVAAGQAELRRAQDGMRLSEAAEAQRARADALESELGRVRDDLDGARGLGARQEEARSVKFAALNAKLALLAEESAEAEGLRAQLRAMRSRSGVEAARTTELEREVRRLERELGAARVSAPAAPVSAAAASSALGRADAQGAPTASPAAGSSAAERNAALPRLPPPDRDTTERDATEAVAAADVDPEAGAVRRPADLARIKRELNRLLALSADGFAYRIDMIGGVRGETLLDVRISGVDDDGRVIRTLEAPTATVKVRADDGDVVMDLRDGYLLFGGRRAPFFDGRYAIVVKSSAGPWKTSGLTCLVFE